MTDLMFLAPILALLILVVVGLTTGIGVFISIMITKYRIGKRATKERDEEPKRDKEKLDYSKEVLEYVRYFAAQIIVLRFQEFQDSHHIEKVTREKFKNIVEKIAQEVNASIDMSGINFDLLLYDKKFIEKYIIQICITMFKKKLNEALIDIEE